MRAAAARAAGGRTVAPPAQGRPRERRSQEDAAGAPAASYDLPERYNGLGFKNLIYMVLQLKAFRDDVRSAEGESEREEGG